MQNLDSLSRRRFLAMTAAVPITAASPLAAFRQFKNVPLGIQLYSVRTEFTRDMTAAVTGVAKIGYKVVEFWAPYLAWTTAQAKDARKLLDDLGLRCHSTHNNAPSLSPDGLSKAIELNQILGSRGLIIASPLPAGQLTGADRWKAMADQLTAAADKLRPAGMYAGFHNHATEWRPLENGQRPMDIIAAGTPKDFVLQLDCGTCVEAKADPVGWIKANPGRVRSMHLKDWGAGEGRGYSVAFGEGDVPWKEIFTAAESVGGIEYYLMEQEIAGPDGPLAMARRCWDNLKKIRG